MAAIVAVAILRVTHDCMGSEEHAVVAAGVVNDVGEVLDKRIMVCRVVEPTDLRIAPAGQGEVRQYAAHVEVRFLEKPEPP